MALPLAVKYPQEVEALVDSGYNGELTLSRGVVTALGLPLLGQDKVALADGSEVLMDTFEAIVLWDGQPRLVVADAADPFCLVGMALLYGQELHIRVRVGERVMIEPLP